MLIRGANLLDYTVLCLRRPQDLHRYGILRFRVRMRYFTVLHRSGKQIGSLLKGEPNIVIVLLRPIYVWYCREICASTYLDRGHAVAWLSHYATSRKVAGSSPG
jgi:hypothetical protein